MNTVRALKFAVALLIPVAFACGDDDDNNTPEPATNCHG
jgi:hypothetical protein